ncbi:MAG TPA: insulinase family protein [Caulobacteraceae bacterium]
MRAWLGALVLSLVLAGAAAAAEDKAQNRGPAHPAPLANDATEIAPTAGVTTGVLSNGLRYALKQNATPKGAVSIRLSIAAGLYDAEDGEVGVAHFVEHMAFAGSGPADETAYANAFQSFGVDHGRDRNAHTALHETSYELDLPDAGDAALTLSFKWLRQVADGATFPDPVVETEKGVLLNESRERSVAAYRAMQELSSFEEMRTRSARRSAPDPTDSISATTSARLRAFYSRWYRPDNAVIVMVGDMPVETMRARIEAAFSSWKAAQATPLAAHAPFERIDPRAGAAEDIIIEANGITMLAVCRNVQGDWVHLDTLPKLRRAIASDLWARIVSLRLGRLARQPDAPFAGAVVREDDRNKEAKGACVTVMPRDGEWRRGLAAAQAEVRRFAAYGATQAEIKDALHDLLVTYWNQHRVESIGPSPAIAAALADALSQGEPIPGDKADDVFNAAAKAIAPEEVKAAFVADWDGAGPFLAFVTPTPPPAGALKAAWAEGEATAPPPAGLATEAPVAWPYGAFGKPGKVTARRAFPTLDMVRLTFDNGVVAYVKTLDHEAEKGVEVKVAFGSGRREVAAGDTLEAFLGAKMIPYMGLGKISYLDMARALSGHGYSVDLNVEENTGLLGGSTRPSDLGVQLEVLAAFAADPGFRTDMDAAFPTAIRAGLRLMRSQPGAAVELALGDALRPGQPSLLPPEDVIASKRAKDFATLLGPGLRTEPLEVTLVGAIDEKTATPLLARTFGALPARPPVSRRRDDAWYVGGLDKALPPITVTLPGASTAATGAVWPLWNGTPNRRREQIAVQMAARILSDVLRKRIREQLGKTYSPAVETTIEDDSDQGAVLALVDTAPADVDVVRKEVLVAAAAIAAGQFDQDSLDRARAPYLAQLDQARVQNAWWAHLIAIQHGDVARIDEVLNQRDIAASITLEDVKQAAATWLSREPTLVTALPETKAASVASRP